MLLLLSVQTGRARADEPSPSSVELEFQEFRIENNQIQRPNSRRGTRFEAADFTGDSGSGVRLNLFVPLNWRQPRDELRVAIAPLTISGPGISPKPITYEGATFEAGVPLNVDYRFNTYRVTYLVPIFANALQEGWDLRAGATIAMRDAQIRLSQGALIREFSNVGPIPLLYMSATKSIGGRWHLLGEFDAFPAPGGGGLFDGSLKIACNVTRDFDLTVGLRYQVGAAEDPEIFNSLRQLALAVGVRATF
jgi:hypothetical protein